MSAVEEKLRKMGYTLPPTFKFPNPNRTGCIGRTFCADVNEASRLAIK